MTRGSTLRLVVRGPEGSAVVHHLTGDVIRIGRAPECELPLDDLRLSRQHLELRRHDHAWVVADMGSRNGTFVNGQRVDGCVPVSPGDEIRLGQFTLVLGGEPTLARQGPTEDTTAAGPLAALPASALPVLVGASVALAQVRDQISLLAPLRGTVLISGETGTGKELVAILLHLRSPRAGGPFVVVNCPALAPGLVESELFGIEKGVATGVDARPGRLEMAEGGTLFLDEIADLDMPAQAKLLRFLQDRTVERIGGRQLRRLDVRIVAATNRDLHEAAREGRFRADLLHRLAQFTLRIPPLRERREDIASLADYFLARAEGPRRTLSREALAVLEAQDWPGNVRSLEHVIEAARHVARVTEISASDVSAILAAAGITPGGAGPGLVQRDSAERLLTRVVDGKESFWDVVHEPFLKRELSRETARELVRIARVKGGGSYRGLARLLRIDGEYKRLMNFLAHHGLRAED